MYQFFRASKSNIQVQEFAGARVSDPQQYPNSNWPPQLRIRSGWRSLLRVADPRAICNRTALAFLALALAGGASGWAQEARTNAARAYRDQVDAHWFADAKGETNHFWYRVTVAEKENEFIVVDAAKGERTPAFDHERLAKAMSEKTGKPVTAHALPFDTIRFINEGKSARLSSSNAAWELNLENYQLTESRPDDGDRAAQSPFLRGRRRGAGRPAGPDNKSPDGKWQAMVRGHNLYLRDLKTEKETPLTFDANPSSTYARDEELNRAVEMQFDARDPETPTPEVFWSPDSKHLVALRLNVGTQRKVYLVESSPEGQLQPALDSYPYLKPGDQVPIRKPHLFDIESKKEIPVDDALFANPWSTGDFRWTRDSGEFTFLFNQRGHQALRILSIHAQNGVVKPVVDEQSKTFICYSGKFFSEYLDDTSEIIWMSERDGWNHLYLYDEKGRTVKNQITKGEWVVRGVDYVDREKRQVYFRAGGKIAGEDPYYVQYCRINFDGTGLTMLSEGNGTHAGQYSPDHRYLIDSWSRVDMPPVTELRRTDDGKLVCKLETADAKELMATGWKPPEQFVSKGRDGVTDIYGAIWRPKDFDPHKQYPVIENIYAGPQDSFTPKAFRATYQHQKLADKGFVVVQMDGFGTSNRSKKFHDYCFKDLADAGFPDRILWMKAAAAKYSYMDLTRVGIYGTSAGGQDSLRGMLDHGDFYKVAVSDSGCHDNRMDKIWWNEQWMGWPVDESYVRSSNVADAHKLQGKLLLMVGEMDKNVDPSSTMQVVNALIKADKDFELLDMPGMGHGVARTPYGARRLDDFFVKNLLGGPGKGGAGQAGAVATP